MRHGEAGPEHHAPTEQRRAVDSGRLTVLIVEDDPDARETLVEALAMEGLHVIGAATAIEALEVGRREAWIDVLVTDLGLPDGRGDAVASALGRDHPAMRSVFLSGSEPPLLGVGQSFLRKPVRLAAILRAIHAHA